MLPGPLTVAELITPRARASVKYLFELPSAMLSDVLVESRLSNLVFVKYRFELPSAILSAVFVANLESNLVFVK